MSLNVNKKSTMFPQDVFQGLESELAGKIRHIFVNFC